MAGGRSTYPGRGGFTLLEVLVALAILGISLLVIMQLFAGGLRSARVSEDYTTAVLLAKSKMEEVLLPDELEEATDEGYFPDTPYRWQTTITLVDVDGEEAERYEDLSLYRVEVEVLWPGTSTDKRVRLSTLKLVPNRPEGGGVAGG